MPSPHASFSGYCCSLCLTAQYRAQPQLDSVRDGTISVRVGVKEREEWRRAEESVCRVGGLPAGVAVLRIQTTTGGEDKIREEEELNK